MGKSILPKYVIRESRTGKTLGFWNVKHDGKPTAANLQRWRNEFHDSLHKGAANAHIGGRGWIACRIEIYNQWHGVTVAEFNPPIFECLPNFAEPKYNVNIWPYNQTAAVK
jgi:hypothetical protein